MRVDIKLILFFFLCAYCNITAQTMYINKEYSEHQAGNFATRYANEVFKESTLEKIQKKQQKIGEYYTKMMLAKQIAYNSLYEVNGALKDGLQVKYLFEVSKDVGKELQLLSRELVGYPEGIIFINEYIIEVTTITTALIEEGKKILRADRNALMSHAERDEIIQGLIHKTKILEASIIATRNSIAQIKLFGFWRKMNPFMDIINEDRYIIQDIIRQSKML